MITQLQQEIDRSTLFGKRDPLLIAVSGGLDSVVLAHALASLGHTLHVAHVNYGLRGLESDADADFVAELAGNLGATLHVLDAGNSKPASGSIQAWARKLRYSWFRDLCRKQGMHVVVAAHHADDQLETMLLNLLRGTGLAGLEGMRPSRPLGKGLRIVRPLLGIRKQALMDYALSQDLSWREDRSNLDRRYARNALRMELAAMDERDYDAFLEAGRELRIRIRAMREFIFGRVNMATGTSSSTIPLAPWIDLPAWARGWVLLQTIRDLDPEAPRRAGVVRSLEQLRHARVGKKMLVGRIVVWKERDALEFRLREPTGSRDTVSISEQDIFQIEFVDGKLKGRFIAPDEVSFSRQRSNEAYLDADKLLWPMQIRLWKPGDYFYPLGAAGRQKVKSFLTNQKVPTADRQGVRVIESNARIAWVVGHRIDERFKISGQTTRVLHLSWNQ